MLIDHIHPPELKAKAATRKYTKLQFTIHVNAALIISSQTNRPTLAQNSYNNKTESISRLPLAPKSRSLRRCTHAHCKMVALVEGADGLEASVSVVSEMSIPKDE
jgi:hypothetical protein